MFHIMVWTGAGVVMAMAAWFARGARLALGVLALAAVSVAGALFGGLLSWILWEFPNTVAAPQDVLSAPVLMSYLLAAVGALAAQTTALGVTTRKT